MSFLLRFQSPFPTFKVLCHPQRSYDLSVEDLVSIWQEAKKTVLFVTHQIEEAVYLSDQVIVMTKRPGRLKKLFEVDLPRPRDYEMRVSPRFNELKLDIWNELKDELSAGGDEDSGHA